jgi:hypothetical protein
MQSLRDREFPPGANAQNEGKPDQARAASTAALDRSRIVNGKDSDAQIRVDFHTQWW